MRKLVSRGGLMDYTWLGNSGPSLDWANRALLGGED